MEASEQEFNLKSLEHDARDVSGSVIAVAGPDVFLKQMGLDELRNMFNKVRVFTIPDDYGEFPDTSGYDRDDWETLESDMEDPALFKTMQKCLDCVLDYNNKKIKQLDKRGHRNIEGFLHTPKFGGRVFAVAGVVRSSSPDTIIYPH